MKITGTVINAAANYIGTEAFLDVTVRVPVNARKRQQKPGDLTPADAAKLEDKPATLEVPDA